MDTTQINHNNSGQKYRIAVDIAKEGSHIWDLTPYFKGRVGDNNFGLQVTWYYQGQLMNVVGMKPYIEGLVGQYSFGKNGEIDMDPDAVPVRYDGSPDDCEAAGNATFYFPSQMFPKEGIFKGFIGVKDDRDGSKNPQISGVTIWFKVLPGIVQMGHACDAYVDELDKALQDFKEKLDEHDKNYQSQLQQVINDARNTYESETMNAHDSLDALSSQIQANRDEQENLSQHLAGTEQQIETHDVITKPEFYQLSNQLTQQVSQMRQSGLEFFDNADALKVAYPQGANKLCVTLDNSHQWVYDYANNQWNDAGTFNFGTLDPKLMRALYAKDPDNLLANSDFNGINMWTPSRDATAPSVYINTDDAVNGSNVAVMNGYIKDGSSNWSYLVSDTFPVNPNKHPNISISAEISLQGINTQAGDQAFIEFDAFDKNNQNTHWTYPVNNSLEFHKITWNNIVLPVNTVKCYLAFTMCGMGQYKIRRPQVNYGTSTIPYTKNALSKANRNLLADKPITTWEYAKGDSHYLVDKSVTYNSYPTLHIVSDTEDYYFPKSPLIKVDKDSLISLSVPLKGELGSVDSSKSRVYVEVNQYSDYNSSADATLKYDSKFLNLDEKFKNITLNNIAIASTTKYIDVRLVTYGKVDIYLGNIALYARKYAPENDTKIVDYLTDKNQFLLHPIVDWSKTVLDKSDITVDYSLLDNNNQPTIKVKTPANRIFGQYIMLSANNLFKVSGRRLSLKFMYRQATDFKNGYMNLFIKQYSTDNEVPNSAKQINILLPNSQTFKEIEFDNILLNPDTKFIDVGFYGEGCIDANFSNFEQITNPQIVDKNLICKFNPANLLLSNYQNYLNNISVQRNKDSIDISSDISDDNYLILSSQTIGVDSNAKYVIDIPAATNYDQTKDEIYLEVEKGKTVDEAAGHNVLALFRFSGNQTLANNVFRFETDNDTNYVCFKLIIHKAGKATFGTITFSKDNSDDEPNIHTLPQLNIEATDNILANWQKAPFTFKDGERKVTGFLKYAMQGDSSRKYPKKNLKIKLFKDAETNQKLNLRPKATWDENNKFNLKANYIDATQARNLVNSKIFAQATAITPLNFDSQSNLLKSQNLGQMEGFPVELYFDGHYYGLMTFNIKKDEKPYGLDSKDINNEAIEFEDSCSGLSSKNDQLDGINYETIIHDQASEQLKTNFHNLVVFINTASDQDFKAKLGNYIDVKSVFNCILWGLYSSMWDFVKKSMILLTWDSGKTWYLTLYDMDSTWNLFWDGSKLTTEDVFDFSKPDKVLVSWGSNLYNRVYSLFKPELQAQYKCLRSNVWRNNQIINAFKEFIDNIPEEAYERDQAKWTDIPSKEITDFAQIQQSVIERGNAMDDFMEKLVPTVDPIENLQNQINQLKNGTKK